MPPADTGDGHGEPPRHGDVVVIADVGEATGTMVTTAVVHGVTLRGTGGTTMNHNQFDATVVLVLAAVQNGVAHFFEL